MTKTDVETLKTKCFLSDYPRNVTKKHDESVWFDYLLYIYIYISCECDSNSATAIT